MSQANQDSFNEVQQLEKIEYLQDQITLTKEESSVQRILISKILEGFESSEIPKISKELSQISLELAELKIESNKMKNRLLDDESKVDNPQNWKQLVNELRFNLEEKSKRE